MSSANPIPRSARQSDVEASIGQTVFGPFDWKIWDTADVAVRRRAAGATGYSLVSSSLYTVALTGPAPSFFTVTFATAPRTGAAALSVRIAGARVHERQTDVTRAGVVRSAALESEFDRATTTLQELRRDVDQAVAPEALDNAVAAAVAAGTAAAEQAAEDAEAARDEARDLTDGLQESVDATLTQVNAVLAAATLAKNDAEDAADQTTLDRAAVAADKSEVEGLVAAAEGFAALLENPDYGFVADAPTETRDYGAVA